MDDFIINNDIEIEDGDFKIGESSQQSVEHILLSHKGAYKEFPLLGVGIADYLKGNTTVNRLRLESEIEKQLIHDNFNVKIIDVSNIENIVIDGNY
ncbi:hypothetical protein M0D21_01545 [Aquimarina sp. D1M17]|uniref:hypothetical protein n=1 Tax=Aquimarina acroporae TaxID=2937283 RepID=UPI0020C0BBFB|nr:hypothetical protein [Aquimarina acroporae]MCK8520228.1 hypothetical protein [Aquimarina acroporae]